MGNAGLSEVYLENLAFWGKEGYRRRAEKVVINSCSAIGIKKFMNSRRAKGKASQWNM